MPERAGALAPDAWNYTPGGYPVLKKWLGYREQGSTDLSNLQRSRPLPRSRDVSPLSCIFKRRWMRATARFTGAPMTGADQETSLPSIE